MKAVLYSQAGSILWWLPLSCLLVRLSASTNINSNASRPSLLTECNSSSGLQRFFFPIVDRGGTEPGVHLPYLVMMDLFFRSHLDPNVTSLFGAPLLFYKISNLHPCLRIEVKAVPHNTNARVAMVHSEGYVHAQRQDLLPNSTVIKVQPTHAMMYDNRLITHRYASQPADAVGIVHLSLSFFTLSKQEYPNFFRAGGTELHMVKALWGFYRLYHWRSFMFLYSMEIILRFWFEACVEYASLENIPQSFMVGAPVSHLLPFQEEAILSQIQALKDKPSRLLMWAQPKGTNHKVATGRFFADKVIDLQRLEGLWMPKYQIIGDIQIYVTDFFSANATRMAMLGTASYGSLFFMNSQNYAPDKLAKLLPGFFWFLGQTGVLSAVDLNTPASQELYGLSEWPEDQLQFALEETNKYGGLLGLFFSNVLDQILACIYRSDFAQRLLSAHNCFLHEGGEVTVRHASLFKHCVKKDGNKVENFLVPLPLDDSQPEYDQDFRDWYYTMGPVYQLDPTSNTTFQEFYNPVVVTFPDSDRYSYSRGGRFAGYQMPVWGNGIESDNVPEELVNCTAGMMKNKLGSCDWCPAGRHSNASDMTACFSCDFGRYSAGRKESCDVCPPGRAAGEPASHRCSICLPGRFSHQTGSATCDACRIGEFSEEAGATECQKCKLGFTTLHIASDNSSMCKCRRGSYLSGTRCLECMMGLDCVGGWPNNWATEGGTVVLEKNHYSLEVLPYDTYKCRHLEADGSCPGGTPLQPCNMGVTGFLCTACSKSGYRIVNGQCEPCSPELNYFLPLLTLVSCVGIVAAFYLSNAALAVNAGHKQDIGIFVGLAITIFQIFGVLKGLEVQWPVDMYDFMDSTSSLFTLDAQSISLTCAVGDTPVAQYLVQALLPYYIMAMTALIGIGTKIVFPALGRAWMVWTFSKSMNVIGQVFQALFIAFCQIMVRPLQCYSHPNGKKSVVMFPQVLCWESEDHTPLTIIGAGILLFFIMPFVGWCVWGVWKAPRQSTAKDVAFLQMFRFLFYRFRPDCWWWGLVFLIRQTCLTLATILPSSSAHAQLFVIGGILAIYASLAAMFWPWISTELSIMDSGSCLVLVLLLICSTQFLPSESEPGSVSLLVILFMVLACVILRYLAIFFISMCSNGVDQEICGETPNRLDLCQQWFEFVDVMRDQSTKEIIETICKMNSFDRYRILSLMHAWSANEQLESSGKILPPRLSNIQSRTSLDEDTVHTAGKRVSEIASSSRSFGSGTSQSEGVNHHQRLLLEEQQSP